MIKKIVAVGDCNTLGAGPNHKSSYPERVGAALGAAVCNTGFTMSTTREGIHLLSDHINDADCVMIQFGLVDSYKTFKYSPYFLYYPDNPARRLLRSVAKKYKKICRKKGLNRSIGEVNVVPVEEYEKNLRQMVKLCGSRLVLLIDTVPNKELQRNGEIQKYNSVLEKVAADYSNCLRVELYDIFEDNLGKFYMDSTHCNAAGYDVIAAKVIEHLRRSLL